MHGEGLLVTKTAARRKIDIGSDRYADATNVDGRRRTRRRLTILVSLETFVSLCGLGGGLFMSAHPLTAMSLQYLHGTWFQTWRWPGLALFFFVGVCPALVVLATVRKLRVSSIGHLCVGVGLISWVTLEAAWIVTSAGLQIAFGVLGGVIAYLGLMDLLESRRTPRNTERSEL